MTETRKVPCVIIPGFGQSKAAIFDKNGEIVRQVWPMKADTNAFAKRILKPYLKTVLTRKDAGFTDTAYDLFREVLEPLSPDENGDTREDVRAVEYRRPLSECPEKVRNYIRKLVPVGELAGVIGEENIYFFAYNAFDDTYKTAGKLDEFIGQIRKETGSEKVDLLTFSMGGTVSVAYLEAYGAKKEIGRVFWIAAALQGSQLQTDILNRNFDKNQGYSLLSFFTNEKVEKVFRRVLAFTTWDVRYRLLYRSMDSVTDTVLMNSAGMWALLPVDEYEELADRFIADEKHRELRKKADRFFETQKNLPSVIEERQKEGVEFYLCAGYGNRMMALSASDKVSSDVILNVSSPSLGAKAAERGKTIPQSEITEDSILSPDGTVDASGCLLKDSTWLLKGVPHSGMAKDPRVSGIVRRAFTDPAFTGVDSDPAYPRFL